MSWLSKLKSFHQRYFSKHKDERRLYRWIHTHQCRVLVEVGIGNIERSLRLLQAAQHAQRESDVVYTGIDPFDMRSKAQPTLTLREVHRRLAHHPAKVRLVPGHGADVIPRVANELGTVDFVLISHVDAGFHDSDAWYYMPRMLHERTLVVRETATAEPSEGAAFELVPHEEIHRRAEAVSRKRRRRAA